MRALLLAVLILTGCSATRPEGGGLTDSEQIIITAAVRSAADVGCDQVQLDSDAQMVVGSLGAVTDVLEEGDFNAAMNALQEQINISVGQGRAALNAMMALRAIIPTAALESQYIDIFGAGTDECVLLLEAKFPAIAPGFVGRTMNAIGL